MSLRGQSIVVTGASSGIGRLTALYLARAGAQLTLAARSAAALESLAREIAALGAEALVVPTDVTDMAAVDQLMAAAQARFGQIDVLVNNAGYGVFDPVASTEFKHVVGMMEVNYFGALRCIQAVLPLMHQQGHGHIVAISSVAGLITTPNMGAYSASKYALVAAVEALQSELVGTPIRCSLVCPGPIDTPFFELADYTKMSRFARVFGLLEPDTVARRIVRTIEHPQTLVVIPWAFFPLALLGRAFPALSKQVIKWVG